uniref:exodeoxyribonuclease III n=1 Tax=Myripristis murdjan TaxID=586833 RepID=A0A667YQW2_9TELE
YPKRNLEGHVSKLTTWNVKGINNVVKRGKILSSLKKEGAHAAFLQETHLIFYSSFNSKSRGVAILLHKRLPFTVEKCIKDSEGRYVIISGFLYGEKLIQGCIYSPNTFEASFYSKLIAVLSSNTSPLIILGGDLNACLEPELDQHPVKSTHPSKTAIVTGALFSDLNLFDTWRILNPKVFTFFSRPHNSFSRIDYFVTSRQALERVKTCSIKAMTLK